MTMAGSFSALRGLARDTAALGMPSTPPRPPKAPTPPSTDMRSTYEFMRLVFPISTRPPKDPSGGITV